MPPALDRPPPLQPAARFRTALVTLIKLGETFRFARDDFTFLWSETTLNDNDCISR